MDFQFLDDDKMRVIKDDLDRTSSKAILSNKLKKALSKQGKITNFGSKLTDKTPSSLELPFTIYKSFS